MIHGGNELAIPLECLEIRLDRLIQPLDRFARVAEVIGRLRIAAAELETRVIALDCLGEVVAEMQGAAQRVMGRRVLRIEGDAATVPVDRLGKLLLVLERLGQVQQQGGIVRIEFDGPAVDMFRLGRASRFQVTGRQFFEHLGGGRVAQKTGGPLIGGNRLLAATQSRLAAAELRERLTLVGFNLDRPLEARGRLRCAIQIEKHRTQVHPGLAVALIQLQGLLEAGNCASNLAAIRQCDAEIVIPHRKIRVESECFAQLLNRLNGAPRLRYTFPRLLWYSGASADGVDGLPDQVDGRDRLFALESDDPQKMQGVALLGIDAQHLAANRLRAA